MKTKYALVALLAALALPGCDQPRQSTSQTSSDDTSTTPEVRKEAREGLNAPAAKPAQSPDRAKVPAPEVKTDTEPGRDIYPPRLADLPTPPDPVTPGVKKEIKETPDPVPDYAPETKDQFVSATDRKLKELDE